MPYTTLTPNTTITSAWANANVRDQVVTPFATASARDSAITAPVEGMLAYLADSKTVWFYNGTAWKPLGEHRIASTTLGSPAANFTFPSISPDYTHLRLEFVGKSAQAANFDDVMIRFNGDSGNNYTYQTTGSSNTAGGGSGNITYSESVTQNAMQGPGITGASLADGRQGTVAVIEIPFFSDTTFGKHAISRGAGLVGSGAWIQTQRQGAWFNAAAITQVQLFLASGANFIAGSRADLYGIA